MNVLRRLSVVSVLLLAVSVCLQGCMSAPCKDDFCAEHVPQTDAVMFSRSMGLGINIGNSLDVITDRDGPGTDETGWGNPRITRDYIHALRSYGYRTVRLPVTWAEHMSPAPDYTIDSRWMDRVQEVTDWCISEGLFVIIDLHHDGGTSAASWILGAAHDYDAVAVRFAAVWNQIAARFRDYPQALIFESMNEVGFDSAWEKRYAIINNLNQLFVDTVRRSGGNNSERYLMAAGYWTDIEKSCDGQYALPSDASAHVMLSVHYYTPSAFTISGDRKNTGWYTDTWGTRADYDELHTLFRMLYVHYLSKGIPVVVGEYGVVTGKDEQSREDWLYAVHHVCRSYGIPDIVWETGNEIQKIPPFAASVTIRNMLKRIQEEE